MAGQSGFGIDPATIKNSQGIKEVHTLNVNCKCVGGVMSGARITGAEMGMEQRKPTTWACWRRL